MVTLLPSSTDVSILAFSKTNLDRLTGVPSKVAILETLWDPWTCPETELPLLAWALSVDIWDQHWSVPRQRQVVSEALLYHRRKTTPAGVRMALSYRDADLVSYNLPRHGIFVDKKVSADEEARWLANLPEIRVYDPAPRIVPGPVHRFAGVNNIAFSDARLSRRAVLLRAGTETPLSIVPDGDTEKLTLPVAKMPIVVAGRAARIRTVAPNDLGVKVLAVRPITSGEDFVRPVATPGDRGAFVSASRQLQPDARAVFTPAGTGGRRFVAPVAVSQGYLSLKFSDTPGQITSHKPLNVVGKSRVTRKAFTAAWTVDWSRRLPRSRIPPGRKVAARSEPQVKLMMDAIQSASAARDTNAINLRGTQRLTYSELRSLPAGIRYGQRKKVTNV